MTSSPADTDLATLERMTALYREMAPAEKMARVRDLTLTVNQLALARLREIHPGASQGELLLRLARRRLGAEVVARVYGPAPEPDGT